MARTVEKGRSAETGQFVPIDYAKKHPKRGCKLNCVSKE